jgi:hypothetical protein
VEEKREGEGGGRGRRREEEGEEGLFAPILSKQYLLLKTGQ